MKSLFSCVHETNTTRNSLTTYPRHHGLIAGSLRITKKDHSYSSNSQSRCWRPPKSTPRTKNRWVFPATSARRGSRPIPKDQYRFGFDEIRPSGLRGFQRPIGIYSIFRRSGGSTGWKPHCKSLALSEARVSADGVKSGPGQRRPPARLVEPFVKYHLKSTEQICRAQSARRTTVMSCRMLLKTATPVEKHSLYNYRIFWYNMLIGSWTKSFRSREWASTSRVENEGDSYLHYA